MTKKPLIADRSNEGDYEIFLTLFFFVENFPWLKQILHIFPSFINE